MENINIDPLDMLAEEITKRVAVKISKQIEEAKQKADLLTIDGACNHLSVSKSTLWHYRNRGMPEHEIGGKVFFFRTEIDEWIREK